MEKMLPTSVVLKRLSTYSKWPLNGKAILPQQMARMGYEYTGKGDTVICSHCKSSVENWVNVRELEEKHRHLSPGCVKASDDLHAAASTTASNKDARGIYQPDGAATMTDHAEVNQASNHLKSLYQQIMERNETVEIDRGNPDFTKLESERVRLSTFHDWPSTSCKSPSDLARNGFFYTGSADKVRCAYCRKCLQNWTTDDIIAREHRSNFPDCPFVCRLNERGGDPTFQEDDLNPNFTGASQQLDQLYPLSDGRRSGDGGIRRIFAPDSTAQTSEVFVSRYPEYADERKRLLSILNGQKPPQGQDPEKLARAGLFYVGPEDNMRCFCCGGGLKNWQPEDDPWNEHLKWFPRCKYLQARLPLEYLINPVPELTTAGAAISRIPHVFDPREIRARMDTPSVRFILEMGYSRELVGRVIENRLTTIGDDFPDVQSLLDAVILEGDTDTASLQLTSNENGLPPAPSAMPAPEPDEPGAATAAAASQLRLSSGESAIPRSSSPAASASTSTEKKKRKKLKGVRQSAMRSKQQSVIGGEDKSATPEPENAANAEPSFEGATALPNGETNNPDVHRILEENEQLRNERSCKVCLDKEANTVFLPCGHLISCFGCAGRLNNCPICRNLIIKKLKIYPQ